MNIVRKEYEKRKKLDPATEMINNLQKELGCCKSTIYSWIRGTRMPSKKTIEKIAAFYGVPYEKAIQSFITDK